MPFGQRKKLWEKYRAKSRKQRPSTTSEIVTGSQVCMKNSPMYQPGAVGKRLIFEINYQFQVLIGSQIEQNFTFILLK